MYVLDKCIVKWLPSHASLELPTVTLHCGSYKILFVIFFRPPRSPADILFCILFIVILSQLTFLSSLVLYSLVTLVSTF